MDIKKIQISPTYQRENGLRVLNTQNINFRKGFTPIEQSLVALPPDTFAANHTHPRQEAIIGFGEDLRLYWKDTKGKVHTEQMDTGCQVTFFCTKSLNQTT